jgi:hypothetical protein
MDELDRILSSEAQLEPSPELARRVMAEVLREAGAPPPLAFPWRRVVAAAVLLGIANTGFAAMPTQRVISAIDGTVAGVVLGTLAIVLGTFWMAWRAD